MSLTTYEVDDRGVALSQLDRANALNAINVQMRAVMREHSAVARRDQYLRTLVRTGASIGANATIVCGHDIGRFAFIGAGAVVTKEVPDYALVVGNPARQTGWMSEYGHKLTFDDQGYATCAESGEQYRLMDGKVVKIA